MNNTKKTCCDYPDTQQMSLKICRPTRTKLRGKKLPFLLQLKRSATIPVPVIFNVGTLLYFIHRDTVITDLEDERREFLNDRGIFKVYKRDISLSEHRNTGSVYLPCHQHEIQSQNYVY